MRTDILYTLIQDMLDHGRIMEGGDIKYKNRVYKYTIKKKSKKIFGRKSK